VYRIYVKINIIHIYTFFLIRKWTIYVIVGGTYIEVTELFNETLAQLKEIISTIYSNDIFKRLLFYELLIILSRYSL